jgi:Ion channel
MRLVPTPPISESHKDWVRKNVYGLVLLVLVLLIVFSSTLVGNATGFLVIDILLFIVSLVIARAFLWRRRKIFWFYVICALGVCILDAATPYCFSGIHLYLVTAVTVLAYAVLVMTALAIIVNRILSERSVTADVMYGGVTVYVLMGFFWFLIYELIAVLDPAAYRTVNKLGYFELLYFSFNTLTTLGYGDIVPINKFAQALCNLEAISGQMFPAIFISRLVSLYVVSESREPAPESDNLAD